MERNRGNNAAGIVAMGVAEGESNWEALSAVSFRCNAQISKNEDCWRGPGLRESIDCGTHFLSAVRDQRLERLMDLFASSTFFTMDIDRAAARVPAVLLLISL